MVMGQQPEETRTKIISCVPGDAWTSTTLGHRQKSNGTPNGTWTRHDHDHVYIPRHTERHHHRHPRGISLSWPSLSHSQRLERPCFMLSCCRDALMLLLGSEQSSSVVLGQDEKPREKDNNNKKKKLLGCCHPHTELGWSGQSANPNTVILLIRIPRIHCRECYKREHSLHSSFQYSRCAIFGSDWRIYGNRGVGSSSLAA